jgi:hypothetical protein
MIRGAFLAALATVGAASGCSLLLDFSAPVTDAGPAAPPDATDTCTKDEPNDERAAATPAVTGTIAASVCPAADHDFYGFTLDGATDLVAVLRVDGGGAPNLQLALYGAGDTPITVSIASGSDERIEHSAALANVLPAGDYALEVYLEGDDARASYQLDLTIGAPATIDASVADAAL